MDNKEKYLILDVELFCANVLFSFGNTAEDLQKRVYETYPDWNLKLGKKEFDGIHIQRKQSSAFIVAVMFWPSTAYHYSVLQHELFHLTFAILDRVGMKLSYDSEEAFAYLHSYITQKVYEYLW